jgi:ADP-ribosylglycohydrolase
MAKDIFDAVYGCIIGGAIGDALGSPVESWYYTDIRKKYGKMTELLPGVRGNTGPNYGGSTSYWFNEQYDGPTTPPGTVTDDTAMRHYLCLAIVRKGGRITPDDMLPIWLEKLNTRRFWYNETGILGKLRAGMSPWDSGIGAIPAGCGTMGISPVGIINAGDPAQAFQDGFNIAFINTDGENRDGAATFAAGVAAAFSPGATVASVISAMQEHSTYLYKRALERTLDLAADCRNVDEFVERYYDRLLDWTWPCQDARKPWYNSGSTLEVLPITAALLQLCQGDVQQVMIEGASFGRDCDTIAGLGGLLAGALQGASAIRQDWILAVERANTDLFLEVDGNPSANFYSMAARMVEALYSQKSRLVERQRSLEQILRR